MAVLFLMAALCLSTASAARELRQSSATYKGRGTYYTACGAKGGGCGIPAELLKSVPYLAVNTNSHFKGGKNCGRWIEFAVEGNPGKTMHAMVADSCGDKNHHCQSDTHHLDVKKSAVEQFCSGGTDCFNVKMLQWKFVSKGMAPKFAWHCDAQLPHFNPLIIYNTGNGISSVTANGKACPTNSHLGSQFKVPSSALKLVGGKVVAQTVSVVVKDLSGKSSKHSVKLDPAMLKKVCVAGRHACPV